VALWSDINLRLFSFAPTTWWHISLVLTVTFGPDPARTNSYCADEAVYAFGMVVHYRYASTLMMLYMN